MEELLQLCEEFEVYRFIVDALVTQRPESSNFILRQLIKVSVIF